jgi:conjugative relaxase-like TrwC/TraI family protein
MLRITQNSHAGGAKGYYSTADYYLGNEQELTGCWRGAAARRLGLDGDVRQVDWDALCDNLHPQTGEQLTARMRADRTVGYDFNFHVPKSVSLLYATTRDERILDAFRDAVDGTMHDMEAEMATRVRKSGKNENRITGNMAWGEFVHFTSRPVDGVPDPHLHAHCFVFNTTFDDQEQAWKAGQFRELNRDAPYFEAAFHSHLAGRLSELGLPIERTKKGWELTGIDRQFIAKFSRRTEQIEEKAREMGIEDADAKAELGAKTRERKVKNLSFAELQDAWRSRMEEQELAALDRLAQKLGGDAEPVDDSAAAKAIEYAKSHVFARKSVVPERQFLTSALWHSVGQATVEDVHQEADRSDLITGERNGRRMVTTREVLAEEQWIIDFARNGRGTRDPFVRHLEDFQNEQLNNEQKAAVKHIVESRDRLMVLRGAAGVGKTTLMREAAMAIESSGTRVFAFAPSTDASRVVLREHFKDADTVATLLVNKSLHEQIAGQLIWIDEAGLMDAETTAKVFELADRLDARVLLSGDRYQHGSVARGDTLRMLETEAGVKPAEVQEIQRQQGAYKEAVRALSAGHTAQGFQRLDELGWVREIPDDERHRQMAADYIEAVAAGKTALVVSPTHFEGDLITAEIRRSLREREELGNDERRFRVLENANLTEAERGDKVNYENGDVLLFHQNAHVFGRGERVTARDGRELPLDQAARFQVFHASTLLLAPGDRVRITHNGTTADGKHRLNNGAIYNVKEFDDGGNIVLNNGWTVGKDWGFLAHGYVTTSHASQGKTVDRVFVGQGTESFAASSREQFYVSASRARERVTIYTGDKEALLDAVKRSDDRLTATEFVNSIPHQQIEQWREQHRETITRLPERDREELLYER